MKKKSANQIMEERVLKVLSSQELTTAQLASRFGKQSHLMYSMLVRWEARGLISSRRAINPDTFSPRCSSVRLWKAAGNG